MKSVAENKKKHNIAEYIIYMYQMEDLIRAYQFQLAEIQQYVISHYPITEQEKTEVTLWFDLLISQMKTEKLQDKGHLSEVQNEVNTLAKIHWDLLKTDGTYYELYNQAKPHILDFILSAEGKDLGHEIQICLNGIYGLLLCRLTGKKIPEDLRKSAEAFGDVLSYLSVIYKETADRK